MKKIFPKSCLFCSSFPESLQFLETVAQICSVKKVFLEISQNLGDLRQACNFIKKETLANVFSCKFCKISKNTFLHRTPLGTGSEFSK